MAIGNITLASITMTINLVTSILKSNHCNSLKERAPVDEIYACLFFQWVAQTYMIRVPGYLSQQWHAPLTHWPLGEISIKSQKIIFKLILVTDGCDISSKIALRWKSLDLSDDKSTLVQVMAWCRQATSHYLNQCWPRSLPPYGVTRPQWVKSNQSSTVTESKLLTPWPWPWPSERFFTMYRKHTRKSLISVWSKRSWRIVMGAWFMLLEIEGSLK